MNTQDKNAAIYKEVRRAKKFGDKRPDDVIWSIVEARYERNGYPTREHSRSCVKGQNDLKLKERREWSEKHAARFGRRTRNTYKYWCQAMVKEHRFKYCEALYVWTNLEDDKKNPVDFDRACSEYKNRKCNT